MLTRRPIRSTSTARFPYAQAYWRMNVIGSVGSAANWREGSSPNRRRDGAGDSRNRAGMIGTAGARFPSHGEPDALLERRVPRRSPA